MALCADLAPVVEPEGVLTEDAAVLLAAKLKTPLQIGRHFVCAFEAGFGANMKPVDALTVDGVLSRQTDDLEPQLTRHGYYAKSLAEQFDARPLEIRKLLRGGFDPARTRELTDEGGAGLPLQATGWTVPPILRNVRRKWSMMARPANHHCEPLQLGTARGKSGTSDQVRSDGV